MNDSPRTPDSEHGQVTDNERTAEDEANEYAAELERRVAELTRQRDNATAMCDEVEEALRRLENATRILDVMLREPAAEGLMSVEDYRAYVQGAWLGVDEAAEGARAVLAGGAGDE